MPLFSEAHTLCFQLGSELPHLQLYPIKMYHDANITEIALKLGYSEVSAFVRAFKRLEGLPPLQYIKQQR